MIFPTFDTLRDVIICWLRLVENGANVQIVHDGLEWSEGVEELQLRSPESQELPSVDAIQYRVLIQIFEQQATIIPKSIKSLSQLGGVKNMVYVLVVVG